MALLATHLFVAGFGGDASPTATCSAAGGKEEWEQDGRSPGREHRRRLDRGDWSRGRDLEESAVQPQPATAGPAGLRVAYQRRALIVVEFFKEAQDTSRGIEYPQVIEPGRQVHQSLSALRDKYPQIEFFRYVIV